MSQRLIFLTIAFMVALTAFSEKGVITKEANMMYDSDEIVLQGLCYFHAGEQGTGVLWDFSGLQGNDGCMTVRHYKDSLNHNVRIDGKSARYYSFVGDTLLLTGSETPLSRTDYECGLLVMRNPINYYLFGAPYSDNSITAKNPGIQPYKYTGKELDLVHGLNTYDHGARQNYSVLGVWDRVDQLAGNNDDEDDYER